MSRASYEQSRGLAVHDFPFYALLLAAQSLAPSARERDMLDHCWKHEFEKRPVDADVATHIVVHFPDTTYEALLMAAMRQADTRNTHVFQRVWPDLWQELERRYHSPGGALPEDTGEVSAR